MCHVVCETVKDGFLESEKVAVIETADGGTEEVFASAIFFKDKTIQVSRIGEQEGKVLIELPRESVSGSWRVWVKNTQIASV